VNWRHLVAPLVPAKSETCSADRRWGPSPIYIYDPAFATLGHLYGEAARPAITKLTLFGGFASTACWPLSAFLVTHFGWRGTCVAYGAFEVAVLLPVYLTAVPREAERRDDPAANSGGARAISAPPIARTPVFFGLLATAITLSAMISTVFSVHLLTISSVARHRPCRCGRAWGTGRPVSYQRPCWMTALDRGLEPLCCTDQQTNAVGADPC
jgi:hypothetical protein